MLKLNIYSVPIQISSSTNILIELLAKDFDQFISHNNENDCEKAIFLHCSMVEKLPQISFNQAKKWQRKNCTVYDFKEKRIIRYLDEAQTSFSFNKQVYQIYSLNFERLHELAYLTILSTASKIMERKGLHKIHAMGVKFNHHCFILSMPMKMGKTTLFWDLIQDQSIELISDDSPLITQDGSVMSFPLRIGFEKIPSNIQKASYSFYTLERKLYGTKYLLNLNQLSNKVASPTLHKIILCKGIRKSNSEFKILKISKLQMMPSLIHSMLIGIGLPIILEIFWLRGLGDTIVRIQIFIKRLFAMFKLLTKSQCYSICLSNDRSENAKGFKDFMQEFN